MRPAETEARGTITNIMLIMRKLIMICICLLYTSDVYKRQVQTSPMPPEEEAQRAAGME